MDRAALGTALIAEAREWIGTPFRWNQAAKGQGCDCKGLIAGVARNVGRTEGDSIHALARDYRQVDPFRLKRGLRDLFDPAALIRAGDLVLLRYAGVAQHLAYGTDDGTLIHCFAQGPRRVIEQEIGVVTSVWPIDSLWDWRP